MLDLARLSCPHLPIPSRYAPCVDTALSPCTVYLQMNEPRFFFNGTSDPCAQDPKKCADTLQVRQLLAVHVARAALRSWVQTAAGNTQAAPTSPACPACVPRPRTVAGSRPAISDRLLLAVRTTAAASSPPHLRAGRVV